MALTKVLLLNADTVIKLEKGQSIEGYYLGFKQTASGPLHVFNTEKGNVGTWGAKMLNDLLLTIDPSIQTNANKGNAVYSKATYIEKKNLVGGKTLKVFELERDLQNTIEAGSVAKGNNTSYVESGDEEGDEDFDSAVAETPTRGYAQATTEAANTAKAFFRKKQ